MLLTILMPCLNEAETITHCVKQALGFIQKNQLDGEVLIADNGSNDGSQSLALAAGARIVSVPEKGYGSALRGGIEAAKGEFVIMGDADASYDFSRLGEMLARLQEGAQLVMGNRFEGGIAPGAMPVLHRYLGNPVLSYLGRLFYKVPIGDFHCGLRGFNRSSILQLQLSMDGMEFASEMVVKSALQSLEICEVPVTLSPDGRSRAPHLRTWRDGWRHLRFLLLFSPRWLFMLPGFLLLLLGMAGIGTIGLHTVIWNDVGLDIHTLAYAGAASLLGTQMVLFAFLTKIVGARAGWLPDDPRIERVLRHLTLERMLLVSGAFFLLAIALTAKAISLWSATGFGALDPTVAMRWVVPSVTSIALGGELFLAAFFIEALRLPNRKMQ